jgi:hypothetical protein
MVPVVNAEIYSWQDKNGTHYTDNKKNIPANNKVKVIEDTKQIHRSTNNNPNYSNYYDCVKYYKTTFNMSNKSSNDASRNSVLICNKEYGINSVDYYRDTYDELDNKFR